MAQKRKTIGIRKLARKDRSDVITLEIQAKVAEMFRGAGFKPIVIGQSASKITAHGRDDPRKEWQVHIEMYPM
jgi:hypothetical protein